MNDMTISGENAVSTRASVSTSALVFDPQTIQSMMQMAEMMAKASVTVPKHLVGKPADCLAIVMQSMQWGLNPFAVAQKTHLSQGGALGYEAQLISAVVVSSGAIVDQPEFEFVGDWPKVLGKVTEKQSERGGKYYVPAYTKADEDGLGVICTATLRGESTPRQITIMMSQCYPRFSTQWATDPQQQITYVAVRKFARRYAPGAILGIYSVEELESIPRGMGQADRIDEPEAATRTESVKAKLMARQPPQSQAGEPEQGNGKAEDQEAPQAASEPQKTGKKITAAAHRRLEALLSEKGIPRERVKAWIARKHPDLYASAEDVHLNTMPAGFAAEIEANIPRFVEALAREAGKAAGPSENEIGAALDVAVDEYGWDGSLDGLVAVAQKIESLAADCALAGETGEQDRLAKIAAAIRAHHDAHKGHQ